MKKINLEKVSFYSKSDILNLADINLKKISIIKKEKINFQISYDGKPFTIGIKACYGIIRTELWGAKFINKISEVPRGLLCDIFMQTANLMVTMIT